MRVKIKGEITPERVADAFRHALAELQAVSPGAKVYGANLYLTPYDEGGMQFDLVDNKQNPIIMTVPAPPGTLVKPGLTSEAQERIKSARAEQRQRDEAAHHRWLEQDAEHKRARDLLFAKMERVRKTCAALNDLTEKLLVAEPNRLIEGLNHTIETTWANLEPKEVNGAKKGQLKPVPRFSILDGKLLLSNSTWKQPRIVSNPVGRDNQSNIAPIWTFSEWSVCTTGFLEVMVRLNGSLPEDIEVSHLPGHKEKP